MAYFPWDPPLGVSEEDPISQHFIPEDVANVTNGADDTHYYYIDMDGVRYLGLQLILDCDAGTVTVTLDATLQDDGTAAASCVYEPDVTNDLVGVASLVSAAVAATDLWIIDTPLPIKYLRIKVVAATGATTGDWKIMGKKLY